LSAGRARIQWLLLGASFLAFGWFHQGGGWNQNARFALVRAVVEEGTFAIDSFLVYDRAEGDGDRRLVRVPVREGEFDLRGRRHAFTWTDTLGRPVPLRGGAGPREDAVPVAPDQVAATGDLAFFAGHFHPNKAPGGSFLAVPAYAVVRAAQRLSGADPDRWWTLTLAAWLTSALSVGLVSALGCVVFFRLALALSEGRVRSSLLATLTFAFGTLFLPYGTALYEHDVVAVALIASFHLLHAARADGPQASRGARLRLVAAGASAGGAVLMNYVMIGAAAILAVYAALALPRRRAWSWYALGVAGPLLLLAAYNVACFSTPFTTNYAHMNPVFRAEGDSFLQVFLWPRWEALLALLFSPYRGVFLASPVLVLGVHGLLTWARGRRTRPEAWLSAALLAFFLLLVSSLNEWHGGWGVGARYLVPALPFLALPLVVAFDRFPRTTAALALFSTAVAFLHTAVDPQAPVGNAPHATVEGRPRWRHGALLDYAWPLFTDGRARPILSSQRARVLRLVDDALAARGAAVPERAQAVALLGREIDSAVREGRPAPLLVVRGPGGEPGLALSELPTLEGPVSVNPVGVYEGWMYRLFPPGSEQARWNSFNAGELLLGRGRLSLVPLLLALLAAGVAALRTAARLDRDQAGDGAAGSRGSGRPPTSQPATTNR
jgi:hypothetical protein